jgi:hypothetical protein
MTINLTKLIYHKKNAFSKEECQFLIDEYSRLKNNNTLEHCPDANTGVDTYSSFKRGTLEYGTEAWSLVFKANETLINEYMEYLGSFDMFHVDIKKTMLYSHMYRLLKYEPGAMIHPHTDHDPHVYGSASFNLNDDYTGGDFVFWNGKHRIKLSAGEGIIWPADYFWVHGVEPVETGVRYSTNSFLINIPQPLLAGLKEIENQSRNNDDPALHDYIRNNQYIIK